MYWKKRPGAPYGWFHSSNLLILNTRQNHGSGANGLKQEGAPKKAEQHALELRK